MASSYSDLGIELMATGENAGTWGDKTNTNLQIVEKAIAGYVEKSIAGGAATTALSITDGDTTESTSVARHAVIKLTGTITGNQIVTVPDSIEKVYIVVNGTSGAYTVQFKTASGTGITFGTTDKAARLLFSDGTNIVDTGFSTSVAADDISTGDAAVTLATSSGDITVDGPSDIILDADGGDIFFKDGGTTFGSATNTSGNLIIKSGTTTAVTFSGANATVAGNLSVGGDFDVTGSLDFSDANITNVGSIALDTITNDGTDITLDSSGDIVLDADGANITLKDGGTTVIDFVLNGSTDVTLDAPGDIKFDADGGDFNFLDGGTEILRISNSSSDVIIKPIVDAKDLIFQQRDGTEVARIEDNGTFNVVTSKLAINGTAITSTAAELNILDGVTSTAAELNILDGVTSTAAELNILDGVTSTAAELNILDGVTSTAAELNLVDGITAGTVSASKAVIVDSNKDLTGFRNLTISGDLTVSGDDITMGTNTAGNLLIADGTNFNSVAVGSLSEISTVADDDVFLAVDTSGGGLKKIARSSIVSGLATSSALSNVADDSTPQLGGNLDMNGNDIVTTSNADLELAPNGTGHVTVRGNTNSGAIQFNCESNSHGQQIKAQPHSAGVTNVMLLPDGADSTLVSLVATQTLTNKTLTTPVIAEIDSGSTITLDATTDIVLDADGGDIFFKDAGTTFGSATNNSGELLIKSGTTTAMTFSGANVTLEGNLTVSGTTTTVNSTTVNLNDHNIVLDSGNSTGAVVNGAGITIEGGSGDDATFTYNTTGPKFELKLGSSHEDLQVDQLIAGSLDISGNVDVDGTLETDALSIASTTVTSTAAELNILDGVTSTTAELNILDGVTSTAAELNILDGVTSTTAELNILDGVTSTTAELNILDGVTSTAAELNILDGVTATAAEINLIDGGTARGTTAVADGDGILHNDGGTMRMTSAATFKTYFQAGISSAADDITAGDAAVNITTSSGNITIDAAANDTDIIFKGTDNSSDITMLTLDGSDAGTAIFNHDIKLADNNKAIFGDSGDLEIYHEGSHSFIDDTGTGRLYLRGNDGVYIQRYTGEDMIKAIANGAVNLYYDNSIKLATTSGGVDVTGSILPAADDTHDLGSSSKQWRDIYTGDINLNNTKTRDNEVDGTRGSWTIQEGSNDLFLLNRLNNKKYKFKLEEIS